jgi:hypothetical protein
MELVNLNLKSRQLSVLFSLYNIWVLCCMMENPVLVRYQDLKPVELVNLNRKSRQLSVLFSLYN